MDKQYTAHNRFARGAFGTVLVILILLTALSTVLLVVRLVDYIRMDDREVLLQSNLDTALDLFSVQYENESGEISVSGMKGQRVIAPGTSVEYTIRLRNKDKVAIDCELIPVVSYISDHPVPILVRMLDGDGNYIVGDARTWMTVEELSSLCEKETLVKGESTEYVFQWKWEFESGDDAYDTQLGQTATKEKVGVSVAFTVHAAANTTLGENGGVMQSGLGEILFVGGAILLWMAAIALMVLMIRRRRESDPRDEKKDVQA